MDNNTYLPKIMDGKTYVDLPEMKHLTLPQIMSVVETHDLSQTSIKSIMATDDIIRNQIQDRVRKAANRPENKGKDIAVLNAEVKEQVEKETGYNYSIYPVDKYTMEQRMHHVIGIYDKSKDIWDRELGVSTYGDYVRETWGVSDAQIQHHWLYYTKEGRKALDLSDGEVKKRKAVISASEAYDLNLIDKVYNGEINWRKAYEVSSRIRKTFKSFDNEGGQFLNFTLTVDQTAMREVRDRVIQDFLDCDKANGDKYYSSNPNNQYDYLVETIKNKIADMVKVEIHNPFSEFKKYYKSSQGTLEN